MLKVKKVSVQESLREVQDLLAKFDISGKIDKVNWEKFSYKPDVEFKIAHADTEIYLQFIVNEKYIRAKHLNDNDSVWTDSCVEFFISPTDDGSYYNMEFNCIGTTLIGFGLNKTDRQRAGADVTSKIWRRPSIGSQVIEHKEGDFTWDLTLIIPVSCFFKHQIHSLSGLNARANFYKCGDELKESHYLTWNPIEFERPNFHLPQYFGSVYFE
jgi:hypothetical protein